jgi:putative peptidoglycan lipid II flippase
VSGKSDIAKSAGGVGAVTIVSRVAGFLRDAVVAHIFGAGAATDAFNIAFTIPNLFRRLLAEGALSIALVPVFSEYEATRNEAERKRLHDATLWAMAAVLAAVTIAGIAFSPFVVRLFAPGFTGGQLALAVNLNRVMFPYLFCVGIAAFFVAIMNAQKSFLVPASAPIVLNVAIIAVAIGLHRFLNPPIAALALGVLAGGLCQAVLMSGGAAKAGYRPAFRWEPSHPDVKRMALLLLPATLGIAIYQINVMVSRALASFLPKASITYIYLSDRLFELPLGVFAVAVATVSLPALSEVAAKKEWERYRDTLSFALRLTLFICVPAMVGLIVLRVPVVSLLFQHGAFTPKNTVECAAVVLTALPGIWAVAGTRNLAQGFYAIKDTKTPVKVAFFAFVVNAAASVALMGPLGAPGLTLANSISSAFNFLVLGWLLSQKVGGWGAGQVASSGLKSLLASLAMGAAVWPFARLPLWLQHGRYLEKAAFLSLAILLGVLVYAVAAYLLRQPELHAALEKARRRIGKG